MSDKPPITAEQLLAQIRNACTLTATSLLELDARLERIERHTRDTSWNTFWAALSASAIAAIFFLSFLVALII